MIIFDHSYYYFIIISIEKNEIIVEYENRQINNEKELNKEKKMLNEISVKELNNRNEFSNSNDNVLPAKVNSKKKQKFYSHQNTYPYLIFSFMNSSETFLSQLKGLII